MPLDETLDARPPAQLPPHRVPHPPPLHVQARRHQPRADDAVRAGQHAALHELARPRPPAQRVADADAHEAAADAAAEDVRARQPDVGVGRREGAARGPALQLGAEGEGHAVQAVEVQERVAGEAAEEGAG